MKRGERHLVMVLVGAVLAGAARADVRVQDIARLQGQRTNRLMGYGLVVGLSGTGDGEKYLPTMRALMALHARYNAPVLTDAELKGNRNVALVAVEAVIPENGARSGQTIDVTVSIVGAAKSLRGGQLLTTPLQFALFDSHDERTQAVLALGGGPVEITDETTPTHGLVRAGATLEEDFFYSFIEQDHVTLVLDDSHAGWTWAYVVARAINEELAPKDVMAQLGDATSRRLLDAEPPAEAIGPKNVVVQIPQYELASPANFIRQVLESPLFMLPEQIARVTINRATNQIAFTGSVRVSPTILQLPGVGTIMIGKVEPDAKNGTLGEVGAVEFRELFETLSAIKVTPAQMVAAIEHLSRAGTLHAQLVYE